MATTSTEPLTWPCRGDSAWASRSDTWMWRETRPRATIWVKVVATDRYGRTVAMIYADKTLLNEELVKAGLAWVYWKYCHHPICESWKNFQLGARFDKRGL